MHEITIKQPVRYAAIAELTKRAGKVYADWAAGDNVDLNEIERLQKLSELIARGDVAIISSLRDERRKLWSRSDV